MHLTHPPSSQASDGAPNSSAMAGRARPSKQPSAMEQALQRMRRMVLDGSLSPGEQIRQEEMATLLGVSRVPLREALNVLADQGLLQHRPHAGYFVCKRSPEEVRQIRRMLELLESEVMETIEFPDVAVVAELRGLNERMSAATQAHDWVGLMHLNREFHFRIFGLSPDRLILDEIQRLWALADLLFAQKLGNPQMAEKTLQEHEAIIDALARADRNQCQLRMHLHRNSADPLFDPEAAARRFAQRP